MAAKQPQKAYNQTSLPQNKSKKRGLFLRFSSENDERIKKAVVITSIFDGDFPLCFYYLDKKHYDMQPNSMFVQPNKTMISELERLLGNVKK